MGLRQAWLWLGLVCLGCQSLGTVPTGEASAAAGQLWARGQLAMREGQPELAIRYYQESLAADPGLVRNHLSLAAAYLQSGDESAACPHLASYVASHPEHLVVRAHLAELLLRLQRSEEARQEFDRFDADAQEQGESAAAQLVHCHSRLVEIAESAGDDYHEHLHRGIGLYLLARRRAALPDPDGELSTEGLCCKAVGELSLARLHRPEEARPCWYLHEAWSQLAQQQPARRWLQVARAAAPFTYLTPAEQRSLRLATQCVELERPAK